jgi:hypothetical protein
MMKEQNERQQRANTQHIESLCSEMVRVVSIHISLTKASLMANPEVDEAQKHSKGTGENKML